MAKKKTNPHKKPITPPTREELMRDVTLTVTHRAWAAFLGSVIDFSDMTQEKISQIWNDANTFSVSVAGTPKLEESLQDVDDIIGMHMPYPTLPPLIIHTQGDLDKIRRKLEKKCLYSAFALMAKPMVLSGNYDTEFLQRLFRKATSLEEDISSKAIQIWEITDALEEEFGLLLVTEAGGCHLLQKKSMQTPEDDFDANA